MLVRIISSVIAFPIFAATIVLGGLPLKIVMAAISIIGMHELYSAINSKHGVENIISYCFIALYYYFIDGVNTGFLITLASLYIMSNLICLVFFHGKTSHTDIAVNIFGLFYVGFLLSSIYLTRAHVYGQYFVWLIFISAWGCDTFALFAGSTLGKHKLTPVLSPKKTVEGSIGGVLGAVLLAAIYGYAVLRLTNIGVELRIIYFCIVVGGFGAVFSQFGDLTASAIKRATGIKDYGKIIPGHGGIMDRFDSVIFTAPIVYIVMKMLLSYYNPYVFEPLW